MSNEFSVLGMAQEYASDNDTDVSDIFKVETQTEVRSDPQIEDTNVVAINKQKKNTWNPNELLDDLPEMKSQPVTYSRDEIRTEEDMKQLKNISDDNALAAQVEAMDELQRTAANIEACKKRRGIVKLNVPPGEWHARITAAAGDTNYRRAQEKLDELFDIIEDKLPEFITERVPDETATEKASGESTFSKEPDHTPVVKMRKPVVSEEKVEDIQSHDYEEVAADEIDIVNQPSPPDVKIVIDKTSLDQIAWNAEEAEKIRKSKTIELNIVEGTDLEFSSIEEVSGNAVDAILDKYERKSNDIVAALPASKYRATFTGLTYTEVLDIQNSNELNNVDGELKKWTICFNHIKNPSIGPFQEYQWYIDPDTKKKIKLPFTASVPPGISPNDVHQVSKFEDFLMKTSFIDLEFMLWKVLCATTSSKEVIAIKCGHLINGNKCNKSYDWVYNPNDLLMIDSIDPAVLEGLKKTTEVDTGEKIMENYKTSPVVGNNTVKLKSSGFHAIIGHCSGYDYLNSVYGLIQQLQDTDENRDPTLISKSFSYTLLTAIKGFLIPKEDGSGYMKITDINGIVKTIGRLDEIDFQILQEITKLMVDPYTFRYALNDLHCPHCHNKSSIDIDSMTRLLFIITQSLQTTSITLKRQ